MSGRAWTRNAIALIVVVVWLGVPAVAGVAAVLGRIQIAFLTQDLLPVWHDYFTPVATLVLGFYFGDTSSGSKPAPSDDGQTG